MHCVIPIMRSLRIRFFILALLVIAVYLFLFYVFIEIWFLKTLKKEPVLTDSVKLSYVIVHVDLKGSPPKLEYLQSLLPMMKSHGVNGLLMEYEDMFPYEGKLANLSARNCYSRAQLKNFLLTAVHAGFEIIPLVQTFGHLEHALKLKEFMHLRETPVYPDSICPSKAESRAMVKHMLEQVVTFHNTVSPVKYIHVGCDEVYHINKCSHCMGKRFSNIDLFIDYIRYLSNVVTDLSPDMTMLIWDDMLRSIKPLDWSKIDCFNNIEPVYWDYEPSLTVSHISLLNYHKKFKKIWAATAFKGADGKTASLPNLKERALNHFSWMNLMLNYKFAGEDRVFDFKGIILTGWSRYSHMDPACEVLPVSIPSLALNLIIIKTFKAGVPVDDEANINLEEFFTQHLEDDFGKVLKCEEVNVNNIDASTCDFVGIELYKAVKHWTVINDAVANRFHSDKTGLSSIEYYAKMNLINMNNLLDNLNWCNNTLNDLQVVEMKMLRAMKWYYEEDFVKEYVGFKTFNLKNQLRSLLKVLYSYMYVRVWDRKPLSNLSELLLN